MNTHALVYWTLFGDALSLGPHWIYNQSKVARLYPQGIRRYDAPRTDYHPGRVAGDLTHYGDQTLVLLRGLALRRGWDEDGFRADWRCLWDGYSGYVDGATKDTLANLSSGSTQPSASNDLAGVSRIGPVLAALADRSLDDRIAAARAQTAVTHGDAQVVDAALELAAAAQVVRVKSPQGIMGLSGRRQAASAYGSLP